LKNQYFTFTLFILISLLLTHSSLIADEGMWMPHQMKMLNLQTQGLVMDPAELYKPDGSGLMSAVVDLGSGTASFTMWRLRRFKRLPTPNTITCKTASWPKPPRRKYKRRELLPACC